MVAMFVRKNYLSVLVWFMNNLADYLIDCFSGEIWDYQYSGYLSVLSSSLSYTQQQKNILSLEESSEDQSRLFSLLTGISNHSKIFFSCWCVLGMLRLCSEI